VWTGTEMIVWGGSSGSAFHITGGRYDPATNRWRATSIASAPTGRELHAAVWTGREMIVWGGIGPRPLCRPPIPCVMALQTGARYRPDVDMGTP
jgi:hypothetical protein